MRWVLFVSMLLAGIGSVGIGLNTLENSYLPTKNQSDEMFKAQVWAVVAGVFLGLAIVVAVGP